VTLAALFAGRNYDIPQAQRRCREAAAEAGLPWAERTMSFNSRLAQELAKWAESRGRGDAFHDAAFRAYFAAGRNIAKTDVLADLARAAGLPAEEAGEVLRTRAFRAAVDADWALAAELNITAVPTFRLGFQNLAGAYPYPVLEKLLLDAGVPRR
jgi:predicted DsbA family dithiol-disulfide isomerase